MDVGMITTKLIRKTITRFTLCIAALLILAAPLFYWLTKNFYAEDIIDIVKAVEQGQNVPPLDLEKDIMAGVMLQYALIATIIGAAIIVMTRIISKRLWTPFDNTLHAIEGFQLEKGKLPRFEDTDVEEFARLNHSLTRLMTNSLRSYRLQKEFTENASHELQTPLAIFRSKLDLLMQQPGITETQAEIIGEMGQTVSRLSHLNRNLLLLAKMENHQYETSEDVDIAVLLRDLLPTLQTMAGDIPLSFRPAAESVHLRANRPLVECMVSNLVVNALRHNAPGGTVSIVLTPGSLTVANTAQGPALDAEKIFHRFYRPTTGEGGNGLGLAIVRSVCRYHGWSVRYAFQSGMHTFTVEFGTCLGVGDLKGGMKLGR